MARSFTVLRVADDRYTLMLSSTTGYELQQDVFFSDLEDPTSEAELVATAACLLDKLDQDLKTETDVVSKDAALEGRVYEV